MIFIYNFGIQLYYWLIKFFSFYNSKAKFWIDGRENQKHLFDLKANVNDDWVWFHFASLGEFEQGRSVLELFKKENNSYKIVVSFFSPSGFENKKNYPLADFICYLPLDTQSNAKKFIDHFNPKFVVFTKYEYWFHYFNELHKKEIPIYLISAIFRKEQIFFKWYGSLHRTILGMVSHFFVQDQHSKILLQSLGINNSSVNGDTRFDRVFETASSKDFNFPFQLINGNKIFIGGSTWKKDEEIILDLVQSEIKNINFIIVPHEIDAENIIRIKELFSNKSILYSEILKSKEIKELPKILIVDSIGLLSKLYKIADFTYIGGGFDKGIHNILEAAAFGNPIIFGPKNQKFKEAQDLKKVNAAFEINSDKELKEIINILNNDIEVYKKASEESLKYISKNIGASRIIVSALKKNIK